MPYLSVSSGSTVCTPSTLPPRSCEHARHLLEAGLPRRRSGRRPGARRTARRPPRGASTARRGRGPAVPAGGCRCSWRRTARCPAAASSRSCLPCAASSCSSSWSVSKWSSIARLAEPVMKTSFSAPACQRLFDRVLDQRLVDDRQHLLGAGLGGRQEPRAAPCDGKHCRPDLHAVQTLVSPASGRYRMILDRPRAPPCALAARRRQTLPSGVSQCVRRQRPAPAVAPAWTPASAPASPAGPQARRWRRSGGCCRGSAPARVRRCPRP